MKVTNTIRLLVAFAMLGGVGNANQTAPAAAATPASASASAPAPAPAKDNGSLLDTFVMRDDVRFTETEESGRKLWEVRGSKAESINDDIVRISNVKATFVMDDGQEINMYTASCDVNRRTQEIQTELRVDIIKGDDIISGVGMCINHNARKFQLFKDVQIVTYQKSQQLLSSISSPPKP